MYFYGEKTIGLRQVVNHINFEVACEMKSIQQSPTEPTEASCSKGPRKSLDCQELKQ